MKIGLYFGTFNPIHVGHLVIANYMANYTELDQIWFVVSPQNPLKQKSSLLADVHRLQIVERAVEDNEKLRTCNIEFSLPIPSYTTLTLQHLKEKHPENIFSLIMGEDNLRTLHKWKNFESIITNYSIYVYPRVISKDELSTNTEIELHPILKSANIQICDAPIMNISASFVRDSISKGRDVRYLLTEPVNKYIDEMNFYK